MTPEVRDRLIRDAAEVLDFADGDGAALIENAASIAERYVAAVEPTRRGIVPVEVEFVIHNMHGPTVCGYGIDTVAGLVDEAARLSEPNRNGGEYRVVTDVDGVPHVLVTLASYNDLRFIAFQHRSCKR